MCEAVNAVPGGSPVAETVTSRAAAVILPVESLVRLNVSAAVPDPFASLPVIAGTSLDGSSVAASLTDEAGDGDVMASSPHPAVTLPTTSNAQRYVKGFMSFGSYR